MQEYVLGFMFNNLGEVLLIRKNRPKFQEGRLNGLGGHIEPLERPDDAMVREFKEECGIKTTREDWQQKILLVGEEFKIHVFRAHGKIRDFQSVTDEEVWVYKIDHLNDHAIMSNLAWQIPLLLDNEIKGITRVEYQ